MPFVRLGVPLGRQALVVDSTTHVIASCDRMLARLTHLFGEHEYEEPPGGSSRHVIELDYWESLPSIQRARADALSRLKLLAGDVICDIGCGAGCEPLRLAQIVGPPARLIGDEVPTTMLVR